MPGSSRYLGNLSPARAALAAAIATVMIPTVHVLPMGVPPSVVGLSVYDICLCTVEGPAREAKSLVEVWVELRSHRCRRSPYPYVPSRFPLHRRQFGWARQKLRKKDGKSGFECYFAPSGSVS